MDVTSQGSLKSNIFNMGFLVQDRLMQMGNTPTKGDIKFEAFGQFCGGFAGIGIAPGPVWHQQVSFFVEDHIAVHHAAETQ